MIFNQKQKDYMLQNDLDIFIDVSTGYPVLVRKSFVLLSSCIIKKSVDELMPIVIEKGCNLIVNPCTGELAISHLNSMVVGEENIKEHINVRLPITDEQKNILEDNGWVFTQSGYMYQGSTVVTEHRSMRRVLERIQEKDENNV